MAKFVKGELVRLNRNNVSTDHYTYVIGQLYRIYLDIASSPSTSTPLIPANFVGIPVREGDMLIVESVELHPDRVFVKFYGIDNVIAFPNLIVARQMLIREATTFITSSYSMQIIQSSPIYKAACSRRDILANGFSPADYTASKFNLFRNLLLNDPDTPKNSYDISIAESNTVSDYDLVRPAAEVRYQQQYNTFYDYQALANFTRQIVPTLSSIVRTTEEAIEDIREEESENWNEESDYDDVDSEEENYIVDLDDSALWSRLGFDSDDHFQDALNDYYWDYLENNNIDEDLINNRERATFRQVAYRNLLKDITDAMNDAANKNKKGKELKFKELVYAIVEGKERPAICLSDVTTPPGSLGINTIVPLMIKNNKGYKIVRVSGLNILSKVPTLDQIATRVRIKDYKESSDVFGYRKTKQSVVGEIFSFVEIEKEFKCKVDNQIRDTIVVDLGKSNFRFVLSDVEFVLPQVNRIQLKKDKSIKVGSVCKIINNKEFSHIPIGSKVEVIDIKATPLGASSKRLYKGCVNKRLDIAIVKDVASGKEFKTYLKNIKFIQ